MSQLGERIFLSSLDCERFGVRTAKVTIQAKEELEHVLAFCREQQIEFLIARCSAQELKIAQRLEQAGFLLTDTLLYYAREISDEIIDHANDAVLIRPLESGDEVAVRSIAAQAFKGYTGHYHADERLDGARCDAIYSDWAYRSCLYKSVADQVLVAQSNNEVVGFIALKRHHSEKIEGILNAVLPGHQRQGIYRLLMVAALNWCRAKHARCMIISTQLNNFAPQKVWTRLGFDLVNGVYTFHHWFNRK